MLAAAGVASDHADLWLPAALTVVSTIGWLPFLLAVVALPSEGDLGFFASAVVLSPSFPLNVVLPAVALVCTVLVASLVSATGGAVLLRAIGQLRGIATAGRSIDEEVARVWLIGLACLVPALLVGVAVVLVAANVAPGEYQSPDLGRGPFFLRLAQDVSPLLALEVVAVVIGQAVSAGATRATTGEAGIGVRRALGAGLRGLAAHPVRRIALAATSAVALAGWLLVTWALLRVLWTPIGRQAGEGALLAPASVALLVGFVAIWLCLVIAGGLLHAWSATWWTLEVPPDSAARPGGGE